MIDVFWGLLRGDTGAKHNPDSLSKLILDHNFEPSSIDAQLYLLNFCHRIYQNEFAKRPFSDYECSMNRFNNWLIMQSSLPTEDQASDYLKLCGGATSLPMNEDSFHACIIYYSKEESDLMILSDTKTAKSKLYRMQFFLRRFYQVIILSSTASTTILKGILFQKDPPHQME